MVSLTGGCSCGALRYRFEGDPIAVYACHCTECRRRSASAFGYSVRVPTSGYTLEQGEPRTYQRTAESGNVVSTWFCGDCGTTILSFAESRPTLRVIMGGSLDDSSEVPLEANIWTRSALDWVHLDPDLDDYEQAPPMVMPEH